MPNKTHLIIFTAFTLLSSALLGSYSKQQKINNLTKTKQISHISERQSNGKQNTIETLKIPILLYHYVEYVQDKNDSKRAELNIPPHIFEKQIVTLEEAGYTFITPKDLENLFKNSGNSNKKYVIVSFDDGYEDFYTDVYPIIKKHKIKVINYTVFNFINRPNYMNEIQIEKVIESGLVEIGAHTLNHRYLTILDSEHAYNELYNSKNYLEGRYNIQVNAFAYPYGAYDDTIKNLVKKAEFTTAVTLNLGNTITKEHLFEIPRIRPGYRTGSELIEYIENL